MILLSLMALAESCKQGGILLEEVLPNDVSHLMTTVGKGVPFIEGADYVSSLEDEEVRGDLSQECFEALKGAKAKGALFLQSLYDASKPIHSFKFSFQPEDPTSFYHYTDSEDFLNKFFGSTHSFLGIFSKKGLVDREYAHARMVKEGRMSTTFRRNRSDNTRGASLLTRVLYVAEDPETSSIWGDHRITLWLHPEARVLPKRFDVGRVIEELVARYPKIASSCSYNDYILPLAEGSGIALYDYYGGRNWFTLISLGFVTGSLTEEDVN